MRSLLRCVLVALLLATPVVAKKRRRNSVHHENSVQGRKRECEDECSEVHEDDRPNCVLRCQSGTCYSEVYLAEELEPGEIDLARQKSFQACLSRELRAANKARLRPEPTVPAAEATVQQQDSTEL